MVKIQLIWVIKKSLIYRRELTIMMLFQNIQTGLASKADKTELNDYILKSGLSSNLDIKNNKIVNLKTATSGNDAVNFTQLNNELSNYLHLTGGTTGDIQSNNNSIYGIKNVSNDTSAVNRKYVKDELKKKNG